MKYLVLTPGEANSLEAAKSCHTHGHTLKWRHIENLVNVIARALKVSQPELVATNRYEAAEDLATGERIYLPKKECEWTEEDRRIAGDAYVAVVKRYALADDDPDDWSWNSDAVGAALDAVKYRLQPATKTAAVDSLGHITCPACNEGYEVEGEIPLAGLEAIERRVGHLFRKIPPAEPLDEWLREMAENHVRNTLGDAHTLAAELLRRCPKPKKRTVEELVQALKNSPDEESFEKDLAEIAERAKLAEKS